MNIIGNNINGFTYYNILVDKFTQYFLYQGEQALFHFLLFDGFTFLQFRLSYKSLLS